MRGGVPSRQNRKITNPFPADTASKSREARLRSCAVVLIVPCLFAGCAVGPDYKRPEVMGAASWRTPTGGTGSLADLGWWQLFQDPVLQELIRTALDENNDLRLA